MGSSYYGDPKLGNERSSSSSSRKGKKSNSDKPKQPQRGLGVAQLEKIRLHSQMACSYQLPSPHHNAHSTTSLTQEDTRLQTAYSSSPTSFSYSSSSASSYAFPVQQNFMIGLSDMERANIRYPDSQPSITTRWHPGAAVLESQHLAQPSMTRHFLNLQAEDALEKRRKKGRSDSVGSSSQNSESSGTQELDLELRLSL